MFNLFLCILLWPWSSPLKATANFFFQTTSFQCCLEKPAKVCWIPCSLRKIGRWKHIFPKHRYMKIYMILWIYMQLWKIKWKKPCGICLSDPSLCSLVWWYPSNDIIPFYSVTDWNSAVYVHHAWRSSTGPCSWSYTVIAPSQNLASLICGHRYIECSFLLHISTSMELVFQTHSPCPAISMGVRISTHDPVSLHQALLLPVLSLYSL